MRRKATCWLVLGTDKSIISGPHWYRDEAADSYLGAKECPVVRAELSWDDGLKSRRKRSRKAD